MAQNITKGFLQLVAEAEEIIETVSVDAVVLLLEDESVQVIDIRDIRELKREGKMPGAYHCPRGMLEFWIDPESPYHRDIFAADKKFIFFCGGGWRSALAARSAHEMGLEPVAHMAGGWAEWKKVGAPIEED